MVEDGSSLNTDLLVSWYAVHHTAHCGEAPMVHMLLLCLLCHAVLLTIHEWQCTGLLST